MSSQPYVMYEGRWVSADSPMGKEIAKWNKPYKYEEYPLMLFRAQRLPGSGKWATSSPTDQAFTRSCQKVVGNDEEYKRAKDEGIGWSDSPQEAIEWALALEKSISTAAAERIAADSKMSEKAQAEAAQFEQENFGHQGEIPEQPIRRRGRPRKVDSQE